MTIKSRFSYLLLLALALGFSACEETKYDIESYTGESFYRFTGSSVTAFESDVDPVEIPVLFSTTDGSSGSVDFQITGGTAGTDYTLLNSGNSLSFDAGSGYQDVIRIQPINNMDNDQDVILDIVLSNPQGGVIGFPGPDNTNTATYKVNILNVLCEIIPIGGDYNSVTTGKSTDTCCPDETVDLASTVNITANGDGTFTIDDFSAGLYLEWYAVYGVTPDFPLPGTITVTDFSDPENNLIAISGSEPFGTSISGTGTYNPCTGDITYTWTNGYDDTGTASLTLQQ